MSTGSEDAGDQADRRSVMSAHSYTQGMEVILSMHLLKRKSSEFKCLHGASM